MHRNSGICAIVALLSLTALSARAEDEHLLQGNWQGAFTGDLAQQPISAQIVALGGDLHRAYLYVGEDKVKTEIKGRAKDGVCTYEGDVDFGKAGGEFKLTGTVQNQVFKAALKGKGGNAAFELKRVELGSPTLGLAPPEGAVVLMDGKSLDAMIVQPHWVLEGDGSAHISGSNIVSKAEFGDAQYHIEFKTPFMPSDRGQARGNSGVYIMGRYEVQVLDSFTDEPKDNLCGGIYQKAVPLVNACLPPTEWQTYDITITAPKYDASGKKTADTRITAKLNGILIHDDVVLPDVTPGGVSGTEAAKGPLMFQDHHDTVSYRNVWVKPLD